jgi:hypothetical protein
VRWYDWQVCRWERGLREAGQMCSIDPKRNRSTEGTGAAPVSQLGSAVTLDELAIDGENVCYLDVKHVLGPAIRLSSNSNTFGIIQWDEITLEFYLKYSLPCT